MDRFLARPRTARGFTLIEMVAVVLIISILASLGYYGFNTIQRDVRDGKAMDTLRSVTSAQQAVYSSKGAFVANNTGVVNPWSDLQDIAPVAEGYVTGDSVPAKPFQVSAYQGTIQGMIPYLAVATYGNDSSECVMRLTYPATSGRDPLEARVKVSNMNVPFGEPRECSAVAAKTHLFAGQNPETEAGRPGLPTNLVAVGGPLSVNLTWGQSAGGTVDGYRIYRRIENGSAKFLTDVTGARTHTDTDVRAGVNYSYYIVAYNASGVSRESSVASATPTAEGTGSPTAPWSLKVSSVTSTGIVLDWKEGENNTTYIVNRNGTNIAVLDPNDANLDGFIKATTFTDTNITAGAKYTYRVIATSASAADTAPSETVVASTPETAPTTLSGAAIAARPNTGGCGPEACVNLSWVRANSSILNPDLRAPATGWRLYRCENTNCGTNPQSNPSALTLVAGLPASTTTYRDTGLKPATAYRYFVFAVNEAGLSWVGRGLTSTTLTTIPAPLNTFNISAATGGRAQLSWTAPTGVTPTGYQIWRLVNGTWELQTTTASTATSWTSPSGGYPAGSVQTFRIAVVSSVGAGVPSAEKSVSVTPMAPTVTFNQNENGVSLSWDKKANTLYDVRRNGTGVASSLDAATWLDVNTLPATTYTYVVTARTNSGVSADSGTVTVNTRPEVPTGFSSTTDGQATNKARLSWASVARATGYRVYYCTANTNGDVCANPVASQTLGNVTNAIVDIPVGSPSVFVSVSAIYNGVEGDLSPAFSVAGVPSAPNPPSLDVSTGKVILTWDSVAEAVYYEVERNGEIYLKVNATNTATTSVNVSDDSEGITRNYRVRVITNTGTSAWSATASQTSPVATPSAVEVRPGTNGGSLVLNWNSTGATNYEIRYCEGYCEPGTVTPVTTSGSSNASLGNVTISGLNSPRVYGFQVRTRGNGTNAPWSPWSATTWGETVLQAPTGVSISNINNTGFTATVTYANAKGGDKAAVLYLNNAYHSATTVSADSGTATFTVTGLPWGSVNQVRAAMRTTWGYSSQTANVNANTTLPAPQLTLEDVNDNNAVGSNGSSRRVQYNVGYATVPANTVLTGRVNACLNSDTCDPQTGSVIVNQTPQLNPKSGSLSHDPGLSTNVIRINSVAVSSQGIVSPVSNSVRAIFNPVVQNVSVAVTNQTPSLFWDVYPGATAYQVLDAETNAIVVASTTANSVTAPDLALIPIDQTRSYRIRALVGTEAITNWSPIVTGAAIASSPLGAVPVRENNNRISLDISYGSVPNAASEVAQRRIYRITNGGAPELFRTLTSGSAGGSVADFGPADPLSWDANAYYTWGVTSVNSAGEGPMTTTPSPWTIDGGQAVLSTPGVRNYWEFNTATGNVPDLATGTTSVPLVRFGGGTPNYSTDNFGRYGSRISGSRIRGWVDTGTTQDDTVTVANNSATDSFPTRSATYSFWQRGRVYTDGALATIRTTGPFINWGLTPSASFGFGGNIANWKQKDFNPSYAGWPAASNQGTDAYGAQFIYSGSRVANTTTYCRMRITADVSQRYNVFYHTSGNPGNMNIMMTDSDGIVHYNDSSVATIKSGDSRTVRRQVALTNGKDYMVTIAYRDDGTNQGQYGPQFHMRMIGITNSNYVYGNTPGWWRCAKGNTDTTATPQLYGLERILYQTIDQSVAFRQNDSISGGGINYTNASVASQLNTYTAAGWNHFALKFNSDGTRVDLYINGVYIGYKINSTALPATMRGLTFGGVGWAIGATAEQVDYNTHIGLDEVSVFNRELTDTEIKNLYTAANRPGDPATNP